MVKRIPKYYLYYQMVGWGLLLLGLNSVKAGQMEKALITVAAGALATHLLRMVLVRRGWLRSPGKIEWWVVAPGVVFTSLAAGLIRWLGIYLVTDTVLVYVPPLTVTSILTSAAMYSF